MKNIFSTAFVALSILLGALAVPATSLAHPGNTAADGCHYCRTNCSKWGVKWNERHCHGGSTTTKTTKVAPKKVTVDPCSHAGLLSAYKTKKAAGENMSSLSTKSWWTKCPVSVRQSVFKVLPK